MSVLREDAVFEATRRALVGPWSRAWVVVCVVAALFVPALLAASGGVTVSGALEDLFLGLDAAQRDLRGMRAHLDFQTPIGFLYFHLHGLAARCFGLGEATIRGATLLGTACVLPVAALVAFRRLGPVAAAAVLAVCSAVASGPVVLDGPAEKLYHLANYNRLGWAAFTTVFVWAWCPTRDLANPRRGVVEACAVAALIVAQAYLKTTFFAASLASVALAWWSRPEARRDARFVLAVVAGVVAACVAVAPTFHAAYLADLQTAARAGRELDQGGVLRWRLLYLRDQQEAVAVLGVTVALLAWTAWRSRERAGALRVCAARVAITALAFVVSAQNHDTRSPALLVAPLCAACEAVALGLAMDAGVVVLAMTLLVPGPMLLEQWDGAWRHLRATRRAEGRAFPGVAALAGVRVVDWLHDEDPLARHQRADGTFSEAVPSDMMAGPRSFPALMIDGVRVARAAGAAGRVVASVSFTNLFPAALDGRPPREVMVWWDYGRTFGVRRPPPPARFVGDAEFVMVPRAQTLPYNVRFPLAIVSPLLQRDFEVAARSPLWTAWRRRAAVSGRAP